MCEFLSWVEVDDALFYLTAKDLKSKRGHELHERIKDDFKGHGAVREYFNIPQGKGTDREETDFCCPGNFPDELVELIKAGAFVGFDTPHGLLSNAAWAEYEKVHTPTRDEYLRVNNAAREEFEKVRDGAWVEYMKVQGAAREEFEKVREATFWRLFANQENRTEAWK